MIDPLKVIGIAVRIY